MSVVLPLLMYLHPQGIDPGEKGNFQIDETDIDIENKLVVNYL